MDRPTPAQARTAARILLALAAIVCAVGMLGPFQGVEKTLISPDKAAHFTAFFGLTLLMFSAAPNRRRFDLVMLSVLAGSGIEILQALTGRDGELGDVLADAAGAFAVYVPVWLEWARQPRIERRQPRELALPEITPERETA
jgi:VanZ family protein